ncbi:hypothetical protein CRUP_015925 [Coryphaenoides rupestris]|nr:hypothetical protein CRUP_015925 [Coryphaenoides rupestris]
MSRDTGGGWPAAGRSLRGRRKALSSRAIVAPTPSSNGHVTNGAHDSQLKKRGTVFVPDSDWTRGAADSSIDAAARMPAEPRRDRAKEGREMFPSAVGRGPAPFNPAPTLPPEGIKVPPVWRCAVTVRHRVHCSVPLTKRRIDTQTESCLQRKEEVRDPHSTDADTAPARQLWSSH